MRYVGGVGCSVLFGFAGGVVLVGLLVSLASWVGLVGFVIVV